MCMRAVGDRRLEVDVQRGDARDDLEESIVEEVAGWEMAMWWASMLNAQKSEVSV